MAWRLNTTRGVSPPRLPQLSNVEAVLAPPAVNAWRTTEARLARVRDLRAELRRLREVELPGARSEDEATALTAARAGGSGEGLKRTREIEVRIEDTSLDLNAAEVVCVEALGELERLLVGDQQDMAQRARTRLAEAVEQGEDWRTVLRASELLLWCFQCDEQVTWPRVPEHGQLEQAADTLATLPAALAQRVTEACVWVPAAAEAAPR